MSARAKKRKLHDALEATEENESTIKEGFRPTSD